MNILLVTNSYANTRLLENAFGCYGNVDVAIDGVNGLDRFFRAYAAKTPYDVIFADVDAHNMDANDMTKEVRGFERANGVTQPSIVISTTHVQTDAILRGFKNGTDLFVRKPIELAQIEGFMRECGFSKES
ncbi:MAG: response regulator [bacterium]|nr:response regulator [bacterium]